MSELSVGLLSGESEAAKDPYYICQRAIQAKLDQLQHKFGLWSSQFRTCNTAADEFQQLHKDVLRLLKAAKELYQTLDTSVQAVVRARKQFPNISNSEISSRKRFVARTLKTLNKIEGTVKSQDTSTKIVQDRRKLLVRGTTASNSKSSSKVKHAASGMAGDYIDSKHEEQEREMKEQDESLDVMIDGLGHLRDSGVAISNTLDDQKRSLSGLDKNVRGARATLQKLTGSMKGFLRTKDDCHMWTLLSLGVLALILLIMNVAAFLL